MSEQIKKLAKELCDKSGCHHKCKEIDECVVMEEAELLLINQDKSNNFDAKSNNELVPKENELPSTLTNEEKVSVKDKSVEKQIEEMARTLCGVEQSCAECESCYRCEFWHECIVLHKAGYRKQSVGEWIKDAPHWNYHCNQCGFYPLIEYPILHNFCPNCGAKMKGGE